MRHAETALRIGQIKSHSMLTAYFGFFQLLLSFCAAIETNRGHLGAGCRAGQPGGHSFPAFQSRRRCSGIPAPNCQEPQLDTSCHIGTSCHQKLCTLCARNHWHGPLAQITFNHFAMAAGARATAGVMGRRFSFEIVHESRAAGSRARVGRIITPHGEIETPGFVGVGTNAAMKMLSPLQVREAGLQLMFVNTYHMMVHPGAEAVQAAGGLHRFMNWPHPLITDSGGFQVFSLMFGSVKDELKGKRPLSSDKSQVLKINEDGVKFRSYRDGSVLFFSPETSVQAQKALGADIIIPFDELPPYRMSAADLRRSLDRTHRWELRSLAEHLKDPRQQAMYCVVHGGLDIEMRKESIDLLCSTSGFDGVAIGGSLGRNTDDVVFLLKSISNHLPPHMPRHLLGIGDEPTVQAVASLGMDTFDSSYPTKAARHGTVFTWQGPLHIKRGAFARDLAPLDDTCCCYACQGFSRSYIHHLFKANEGLGLTLASIHNLTHINRRFAQLRQDILNDKL
eukprot:m.152426 g.152426  ORF g.152426 m.152426 type:complete len:508 (+) comp10162_c1_seq1:1706-3229(+)